MARHANEYYQVEIDQTFIILILGENVWKKLWVSCCLGWSGTRCLPVWDSCVLLSPGKKCFCLLNSIMIHYLKSIKSFLQGILPWQKADLIDPYYSEFCIWRSKRTGKVPRNFKPMTSRAQKLFRKVLDPEPDKRLQVGGLTHVWLIHIMPPTQRLWTLVYFQMYSELTSCATL